MQHRPTAARVPDPGIRALFTRESPLAGLA